jgi:uncharacterized protein (DUF305 family)
MKSLFFVCVTGALFGSLSPALAQHEGHDMGKSGNAMMKVMDANMKTMMAMKPTGDADHDFASMMKMHHQGAVDMVNSYTPQAKNAELKKMAGRMLTMQKKEIGELTAFLGQHKPQGSNSNFSQQAMRMMHQGGSHTMTGKADRDFAAMMIQHHQQGIDMANAFLKEAKTEKMRSMAQKVVKEQTKDITELKAMEAKLKS